MEGIHSTRFWEPELSETDVNSPRSHSWESQCSELWCLTSLCETSSQAAHVHSGPYTKRCKISLFFSKWALPLHADWGMQSTPFPDTSKCPLCYQLTCQSNAMQDLKSAWDKKSLLLQITTFPQIKGLRVFSWYLTAPNAFFLENHHHQTQT